MEKIKLIDTDTMDYLVTGTYANIGIDIWIKFTSHFKEAEIEFLGKIKNDTFNMPIDKMEMYMRLENQKKLAILLKKYKERKCTKTEHDIVKKFMNNNKLEEFVSSRMTAEEKDRAEKYISDLTKDELKKYIDINKDNYEKLAVFDAYILFIAKEKLYEIEKSEFIDKEMQRQKEDAFSLRKSILRDFGILH